MEDIIVTAVQTGGSGGEDRLTENVSLNFAKFKFEYQRAAEGRQRQARRAMMRLAISAGRTASRLMLSRLRGAGHGGRRQTCVCEHAEECSVERAGSAGGPAQLRR